MKNRRRTATKTKRPRARKVGGRRTPSIDRADANTNNTLLKRERDEALEQQQATAEVLRLISASSGKLEPVFDAILASALRLCEAKFGSLLLVDGDGFRAAATKNAPKAYADIYAKGPVRPGPHTAIGRMAKTKSVVHIHDIRADRAFTERDPLRLVAAKILKARTFLAVPMLKEGELIGAIIIRRQEVRPFTNKQIELLTTFADQAVIAIENARLFEAEQQRTRELAESLEQQTATSEILKIISGSPGMLQPVFDAVMTNATRLCDAKFGGLFLAEGDKFRCVAMYNLPRQQAEMLQREPLVDFASNTGSARAMSAKRVIEIEDLTKKSGYIERNPRFVNIIELGGARSAVFVPLVKDAKSIGVMVVYRREVGHFTDKQIELVQNFAAQAVIAIENTRLLNELRQRTTDLTESLEQQTATADVLKVISASPGELEPVFQAMLENAIRICEAKFGTLFRFDGEKFHLAAQFGPPAEFAEFQRRRGAFTPTPGSLLDEVMRTKRLSYTADNAAEPVPGEVTRLGGARSRVVVPMLKEGDLVGTINIYRQGSARSPTSKSRFCRTSPPRPSSPSRTRGCLTN